jgi:uncharacterized protein
MTPVALLFSEIMQHITDHLNSLDWTTASEELHLKGYTLLPAVLSPYLCDELINHYDNPALYRKTIVMERYRFGLGEYKYFGSPLPELIRCIRETVYSKIAPIANHWMQALKINTTFPENHIQFQALCHRNGQTKPTVLILKYGKGGHNTLHQDLYGDIFFPIQLVLFLNEPNEDYSGGEFVLTEQIPRAQSKALVLQPKKGDMLLFTTNFRPVLGSKGYYRVNMKHGVSPVHEGNRYTLGIIFHEAAN